MIKSTRRTRAAIAWAAAAAAALALAGCSSGTPASDSAASGGGTTTLKVATIGLIADGALQLGIEQGFFEEEGILVRSRPRSSPTRRPVSPPPRAARSTSPTHPASPC